MELRPKECTDEMLKFLDDLKKSKTVNMFGASVNLNAKFKLPQGVALKVFGYWMDVYRNEKH